ncbi:MAG: DUF2062 domain-containing protein [Thermodesulfobacteriota bacterium]
MNRGYLVTLLRRVRYYYLRLLLIPETPRRVAAGLAVGVFIGLLPIIPFQTVTAVGLAFLFRGSKVAAAIGALVTNPLTIPPLYAVFYYLGRALTPFGQKGELHPGWDLRQLMDVGLDVVLASMIGGAVLGLVCAPLTYWLTWKYIGRLQQWERRKLREKFGLSPPDSY